VNDLNSLNGTANPPREETKAADETKSADDTTKQSNDAAAPDDATKLDTGVKADFEKRGILSNHKLVSFLIGGMQVCDQPN